MSEVVIQPSSGLAPGTGSSLPAGIDEPGRELRFGLIVAGLFFVAFLGWAAFAPLDSAAYAVGKLVVSGQRQAVQHREGGVVAVIRVKEGQKVAKGQVLVELAGSEVRAQERALGSQLISLQAQRARLQAEQIDAPHILWPAEFAALRGDAAVEAERSKLVQINEFEARRQLLAVQTDVLGQQTAQALQSATGYSRQRESTAEQERLIVQELESLRTVAEKGFVSMNRIRALERARAELQGQRGQYQANVAQSSSNASETRLRQLEARRSYRERGASELHDVEASIGELLPRYSAARDQLARLEIRAPASGTVMGLSVFTVGGVIAPGAKIMDIVPERAELVIEAQVSINDGDDLQVGQDAQVRFTGLHDRGLGVLEGKVTRLSADSFVDEASHQSFYTAEIRVGPHELEAIREVRGKDFHLRPGAPVQVIVPLKKRTALQYAFEPLTQAMWLSFREH